MRAAQRGLDAASALAIGATRFDVSTYAQRTADGAALVGGKAELVHRISQAISLGANGFAERDIGKQSSACGAGVFGRLEW